MSTFWKKLSKTVAGLAVAAALVMGAAGADGADAPQDEATRYSTQGNAWS